MEEKSILILKDYHRFLNPEGAPCPLPIIFRKFKDALFDAEKHNKTIIILSLVLKLPPELEKLICVVDFALPDKDQIALVLTNICENNSLPLPEGIAFNNAVSAASGLTTNEAKDAFSLALIESGTIDPKIVDREKADAIAKNGILEVVYPKETIESIGGLEVLRQWLNKRRKAFTQAAALYQLPSPKGLLIAGIPGTGKSLAYGVKPARRRAAASASTAQGPRCFHERGMGANDGTSLTFSPTGESNRRSNMTKILGCDQMRRRSLWRRA